MDYQIQRLDHLGFVQIRAPRDSEKRNSFLTKIVGNSGEPRYQVLRFYGAQRAPV